MNGNITTSRMGIIGKRLLSGFSLEVSIRGFFGCSVHRFFGSRL
jgi:hypothetical protein